MKREREKHITRLHIILFAIVVITTIVVLIIVKTSGNKKIEKYKKLESDLKTATTYFYGDKAKDLEKGRIIVIKMDTLIKNGYLQDSLTSECTGYTIIGNYKQSYGYEVQYDSYIKCGKDYQTDNYSDDYLN